MARQITNICDKCGKTWTDNPNINVFNRPMFNISVKSPYFDSFRQLDLCDKCSEDLYNWLFEKESR